MTELIRSYLDTAKLLKERICQITQTIKNSTNADEIKALNTRRDLLEDERYDMLGAVSAMLEYVGEEKVASGDY